MLFENLIPEQFRVTFELFVVVLFLVIIEQEFNLEPKYVTFERRIELNIIESR